MSKKKNAPSAKKSASGREQIVLSEAADKALRLIDRSAKAREELEKEVTLAAVKAVRKVLKKHGIALPMPQATVLAEIWFGA